MTSRDHAEATTRRICVGAESVFVPERFDAESARFALGEPEVVH